MAPGFWHHCQTWMPRKPAIWQDPHHYRACESILTVQLMQFLAQAVMASTGPYLCALPVTATAHLPGQGQGTRMRGRESSWLEVQNHRNLTMRNPLQEKIDLQIPTMKNPDRLTSPRTYSQYITQWGWGPGGLALTMQATTMITVKDCWFPCLHSHQGLSMRFAIGAGRGSQF